MNSAGRSPAHRIALAILSRGAAQPMIGTALMLFCGLPVRTRSL